MIPHRGIWYHHPAAYGNVALAFVMAQMGPFGRDQFHQALSWAHVIIVSNINSDFLQYYISKVCFLLIDCNLIDDALCSSNILWARCCCRRSSCVPVDGMSGRSLVDVEPASPCSVSRFPSVFHNTEAFHALHSQVFNLLIKVDVKTFTCWWQALVLALALWSK